MLCMRYRDTLDVIACIDNLLILLEGAAGIRDCDVSGGIQTAQQGTYVQLLTSKRDGRSRDRYDRNCHKRGRVVLCSSGSCPIPVA
jgi:hypothetical protein